MSEKNDNMKKNVIWNTIGSFTLAITSLFYTVILTRIGTLNITGLYTIAFAIACNTVTLASFGGRTYQITDTKNEISTFSYIFARYSTVVMTILILIPYLLIKNYDISKSFVIFLVCLFKYFEEVSDVYYGILQKKDRLYKVGQLQFFKSIINIIVFLLLIKMSNNLIITFSILIFLNLIFFLKCERSAARKCDVWNFSVKKQELIKYLKANLLICLLTFLTTYIINSPKYSIDALLKSDAQAIFGIIIMPATVMLLVGNFILNPIIVNIAQKYNENKLNTVLKITFKVFGLLLLFGIFGVIMCYFLGIPFLNIIYNLDLKQYKIALIIIIIGSIFYALTATISTILVAMRKLWPQIIANIFVAIISIILCNKFISSMGIMGASLSYMILIFVRFIIYLLLLLYYLCYRRKK